MGKFPGKELNPKTLGWTSGAETASARKSTSELNESQDRKGLPELLGEQPGSGICKATPVKKLRKSKRARATHTQLSTANRNIVGTVHIKWNSETISRSASTPTQLSLNVGP